MVEGGACIGTEGDGDTTPVGPLEAGFVSGSHRSCLEHSRLRNATGKPAIGSRGEGRERRDHEDPLLIHQGCSLIVHQRGVFDRMGTGPDRVLHPLGAVSMSGDATSGSAGLGHAGFQFFRSHLRRVRGSARGQHPSGRDKLDHLRSPRQLLTNRRHHFHWTISFPTDEAGMASGHAHGQPCRHDTGTAEDAVLDGLSE